MRLKATIGLVLTAVMAAGCEEPIDGLIRTPAGNGPTVVWDLMAKPLPEIPFPNDVATRPDMDSPTGRRINVALVAPTRMERLVRNEFSRMDGWGTFAPITISFEAPIDPLKVRALHLDDDPSNDAVYLVDLTDGSLTPVDLGRGNFPITVNRTDRYYELDPRIEGTNLLFETYSEDLNGNGVLDPGEDTDGDGILDVPNTVDPTKPRYGLPPTFARAPPGQEGNDVYRDLLDFYERETNTLIIRPVVPLQQRREYAVVITDRVVDHDGNPIRSPFPAVHHASQTEQLRPLLRFLDGTVPGLEEKNVAFAWAFTTQTVTKDLEDIREGLYGNGPLGWLSEKFPPVLEPVQTLADPYDDPVPGNPVYPLVTPQKADADNDGNPYLLKAESLKAFVNDLITQLDGAMGIGDADVDALLATLDYVDYLVIGSYQSPNFMDDPSKPYTDSVFRIQPEKGLAQVWQRPTGWEALEEESLRAQLLMTEDVGEKKRQSRFALRDRISFILVVPKAQPERGIQAPFPVSLHAHGANSSREEVLLFGGYLARFGIATIGINGYTHGIDLDPTLKLAITGFLESRGLGPLAQALLSGRSRDLDFDGTEESGSDFWVADTFHARDAVRQSAVDYMQLVRVLRAFGTYRFEGGILDKDGKPALAGDFNGDGVVDVAGPKVPNADGSYPRSADMYMEGISLGGIMTSVVSALEPEVVAAVAISGGGGLGDIAARTELGQVLHNVFPEVMGPIFITRPAEGGGVDLIQLVGGAMKLTKVKINGEPLPIEPGDRLELVNLTATEGGHPEHDTALVDALGNARLQVAGDGPKYFDDTPFRDEQGNLVRARAGACEDPSTREAQKAVLKVAQFADCYELRVWRTVNGAEKLVHVFDKLGTDVAFRGKVYEEGSPFITFASGFGFKRQSPTFRRFIMLAQMMLEPADPVNYGPTYMKRPLAARKDKPLPILMIPSGGDMGVPITTAYSLGRASGVLDFVYDESKHAAWGMSPNDVAIRTKAIESNFMLRYYKPVADFLLENGNPEDLDEDVLKSLTANMTPVDKDMLKLIRCVDPSHCDKPTLPDLFNVAYDPGADTFLDSTNGYMRGFGGAPRLKVPLTPVTRKSFTTRDHDGSEREVVSAMIGIYPNVHGLHVFDFPNPASEFDIGTYVINMTGTFLYYRGEKVVSDLCLHRDGYTGRRADPGVTFDPACEAIPRSAE